MYGNTLAATGATASPLALVNPWAFFSAVSVVLAFSALRVLIQRNSVTARP